MSQKFLSRTAKNIEREVLEATALEGYRKGKLSQAQVRRMLGFQTDMQVDGFFKGTRNLSGIRFGRH